MNIVKNVTRPFKLLSAFMILSLFTTVAMAQDGGGADVNIKVTKDDGNWYAQPWVWIVGGAVFLLLLVALMRGNNNK